MNQKNVRKDVYPIRKGLKASESDSVKNMIPTAVINILRQHPHFNDTTIKILELAETPFIKIYGKGVTIETKKAKKLPPKYQGKLLSNSLDIKSKSNKYQGYKRYTIKSYQPTIDRLVVYLIKRYISKQKHKILADLYQIKQELIELNGKSVTNNNNNIIDNDDNIYVVNKLIEYYSQH